MDGFVWYSFGSDKTGPILAKALAFSAGKKTPDFGRYEILIGWGCKPGTKYDSEQLAQRVAQNQIRVLNHPDAVAQNRDKLGTLERLQGLGISVPGFLAFDPKRPVVASETLIPRAVEEGRITFPMILLTRHNRGEPIFCYTSEDVRSALKGNTKQKQPLCYARTYDHGDEYRVHVFRDTALCAQKKDMQGDPAEAAIEGMRNKIMKRHKREALNLFPLHGDTLTFVLRQVAGELVSSASQLKKSVQMGWSWQDWGMDLVPAEVAGLAIEALDAVRLDMGAVTISHVENTPRVLSITTAPALDEEQMSLYVSEVSAFVESNGKTKSVEEKKAARKRRLASPELVARLYRRVRDLSADKAEEVLRSLED
jgi:hypothetical protein